MKFRPNLSEREREVFGTTYQEEQEKFENIEMRVMSLRLDLESKIMDGFSDIDDVMTEAEKRLRALDDPEITQFLEYEKWKEKYDEWYQDQPEVIEYFEEYDKEMEVQESMTFTGQRLNQPGVLIETEDGAQFLIGEINPHAGVCDDCTAFDGDTVVKRYKVIFEKYKDEIQN